MKSIVLTGMPGCGKSTVGVLLAKSLGLPFVDTDLLLQCREGALLRDILARGIDAFLEAETRAVCSVAPRPAVVATGGSVVLSEAAMAHLRAFGAVVFIDVGFPELEKRLKNIKTRGVVIPAGQSLEDVYRTRRPYYERYADFTVAATGLSPERVVDEIARMPCGKDFRR